MQRWQLQDLLHAADAKLQLMTEGVPYSVQGEAPRMVSSTEVKRPPRIYYHSERNGFARLDTRTGPEGHIQENSLHDCRQ